MKTFSIVESIEAAGGDTVVAGKVGKSTYTVARWRRGEAFPSVDDQVALAKALDVPLETLAVACARAADKREW